MSSKNYEKNWGKSSAHDLRFSFWDPVQIRARYGRKKFCKIMYILRLQRSFGGPPLVELSYGSKSEPLHVSWHVIGLEDALFHMHG